MITFNPAEPVAVSKETISISGEVVGEISPTDYGGYYCLIRVRDVLGHNMGCDLATGSGETKQESLLDAVHDCENKAKDFLEVAKILTGELS